MNKIEMGCLYVIIAMAALIGYGFGIKERPDNKVEIVEVMSL